MTRSIVLDAPARKIDQLDVLFVIDSSTNMAPRQERLAIGFEHLLQSLQSEGGILPDLHVGVISPDLGAGQYSMAQGCSLDGDRGELLLPTACGVDGNFLRLGGLDENFAGEATDVFACMTALGESGCDFEQPLEAMRRALSGEVESNAGFLRPSAALAVVVVSDEDDCSARSDSIFDPESAMFSGSDAEWRCFSSGVRCGNDDDVFPPGWQAECVAREDSSFVHGINAYGDFIRGLKSDPAKTVVTGIIGEPSIVRVSTSESSTSVIEPACDGPSGHGAFPGVRLRRFFDRVRGDVPIDESYASMCRRDSEAGILGNAAARLRMALGSSCLRGQVLDIDGDTPGPQVDCVVKEVYPDRSETLAACDNRFDPTQSSAFPCYTIEPGNDVCNHEPTRLSVRVIRSRTPDPSGLDAPIDARLQASCVLDDRDVVVVE